MNLSPNHSRWARTSFAKKYLNALVFRFDVEPLKSSVIADASVAELLLKSKRAQRVCKE